MTDAASRELLAALPPDALFAPEQDMWLRLQSDGSAIVGATHVVAEHGQFMFCTPRPAGTDIARDRSLGVMETAKTAVAIHAPVSCRILAFNDAVSRDIELVAREPYGAGWLFRIQPTAWDAERSNLLDAAAYAAWLAPRLSARSNRPIEDAPDLEPPGW